MSAMPQPVRGMTETEYLAYERASEFKHEFMNGEVIAMTGASLRHNLIVGNLVTSLNNQLEDRPCIVSPSDLRVKIASARAYRYPDVSIVCDEPLHEDNDPGTLLNPAILIEVLSLSTALIDRNDKLREYRQIPLLHEYLLVSQDSPRIERYLRQDDKTWLYSDVTGLQSQLELPSLTCMLSLADVYRKVTFSTE